LARSRFRGPGIHGRGHIGDAIGLAGSERQAAGALIGRSDGCGPLWGVGLQNVQAEDIGFRIEEREVDKVEGDQAPEAAAQVGKKGG